MEKTIKLTTEQAQSLAGISPEMDELEKLNLICLLYDVIRGYTFELGREAQRGIKFYANRADAQLALLQKQFDRIIPDEADQFGDDSDRLRAAIEKFVLESKRKNT